MKAFNIEKYLNSLPKDIETINVSYKGITYLPSLQRFHKLRILYCENNKLTILPEFNHSLLELWCNNNQLTILPEFNYSLKYLSCYNNKLTMLPELNHSLCSLNCSNNQLTMLPELNHSLKYLDCSNNQLTMLPELNHSLQYFDCSDNKLPYKLNNDSNLGRKNEINYTIQLLKRVRFTIMAIKYKKKFHDWLWIKIRLPKIQKKYHPDKLRELLKDIEENDEKTVDTALDDW